MKPSNNLKNKTTWDNYWRVQLVCKKIQAYSSLEPPLEYRRIRRFMLLVQTKNVISMNYGSSTSSWKPWRWVRLDLIFSMRDIYINFNLNPLTKFTSSSRSAKFKDILPWNISQMIMKTVPISTRIVISYAIKWISHCEFDGNPMETETTT